MHLRKPYKTNFPAALLLMHLLATAASASPLWGGGEPVPRRAEPSWSPADTTRLLQADPWFDTAAKEPLPQLVPVREAIRGKAPADWDTGGSFGMPAEAARSVSEQLREFVRVEPRRMGPGGSGRDGRPGQEAPGNALADFSPATDVWVRETVESLINAALQVDANEAGRVYFSVLGLGEFSVTVSGDRSQVTLAEGDDVLLFAQRTEGPAHAGSGSAQVQSGYRSHSAIEPLDEKSQVRRAIELIADVAGHPVSLLAYCVAAAYVLLWSVLSQQQHRTRRARAPAVAPEHVATLDPSAPVRRRSKSRRHITSRRHTTSRRISRAAEPSDSTQPGKAMTHAADAEPVKPGGRRRKRIRVRVRVRTRRPLPGHRS
jgi:hypothetical protein